MTAERVSEIVHAVQALVGDSVKTEDLVAVSLKVLSENPAATVEHIAEAVREAHCTSASCDVCHTCQRSDCTGHELEALREVASAAGAWYEVQRGTMASLSPSGLRVRAALEALAKADAAKGAKS